jgi:hypothetical protein
MPVNRNGDRRWSVPVRGVEEESDSEDDDDAAFVHGMEVIGRHLAMPPAMEEDSDDIIIGVTISAVAQPKLSYVEHDEICCFCWDDVDHNGKYYLSECKHIYCGECIAKVELNKCTRCNQDLKSVDRIVAVKVKIEDLD